MEDQGKDLRPQTRGGTRLSGTKFGKWTPLELVVVGRVRRSGPFYPLITGTLRKAFTFHACGSVIP